MSAQTLLNELTNTLDDAGVANSETHAKTLLRELDGRWLAQNVVLPQAATDALRTAAREAQSLTAE